MEKRQQLATIPEVVRSTTDSAYIVWGVSYRECQKNHAANVGGYAVDGCREFMASGEGTQLALVCAACSCHRSFHRREVDSDVINAADVVSECSSTTSSVN